MGCLPRCAGARRTALNYSYQEVPFGAKQQELNSIASVPGLIEFRRPRAQKRNFAPRVGLAYSPTFDKGLLRHVFGEGGTSSLRAGFSVAHDVIFDNIYILGSPSQFQQTLDVDPGQSNFLAGGGIRNIPRPTGNDPAASRSATTTFIGDQQVPYSLAYTLSFQRQFLKDFSFEARYLGTRGIHLLTQNRANRQAKIFDGPGGYLPTYLARPTQAQLNSLHQQSGLLGLQKLPLHGGQDRAAPRRPLQRLQPRAVRARLGQRRPGRGDGHVAH